MGQSDVDRIRKAARTAATVENLAGGGRATDPAARYLRTFAPLLRGHAAPATRQALFEGIGNLSGIAAYSAFDIADYPKAERRFRFALWCADTAGSWELRAATLADMARMTAYIGNADGALSLIELAQVRSDRLTATTRAMLSAVRAQFLSALGRTDKALSEVARADEHFAARAPEPDAPWMCYYDQAEHLGSTGKALIPVAIARERIDLAAPRIHQAIQLQGEAYPRSRTFSRTRLAALTMRIGDPHEATVIGLQAATDSTRFRSRRLRDELHGLVGAATPHRRIREVAELCHVITSLPDVEATG
ncbi:XRE family transcriptional regulator [Nocardia brevicatena]|uniref:XRE family transcriptional regulator n=1 Tax=Nocardia brevicatena TaxID=37327 RepID=UPI0012F9A593|nr:XRE family transcriptional regulator [Nocardia brevicatena]